MAVPTGFEPAIFSLTGRYARPLHHGISVAGAPPTTVSDATVAVGRQNFLASGLAWLLHG